MRKLIYIFLLFSIISFGQNHSIDQYNLQMSGNTNDNDISINTYYNTLDTCSISWNIIKDSLPSQWDFSFCFPDCYALGVANAQNIFFPNEQVFLNCHMYPNGQEGDGIIQMEIITNNLYKDTVTWIGSINSISFIDELNPSSFNNKSIKILDVIGREVEFKKNKLLFYIYDDGTVEKRINLD